MIYLFSSSKNGWLKRQGLFLFEKPIFSIKVYKNRVYFNNKILKTKKPLKIVENLIKNLKLYAVGFISYDYNDFIISKKIPKKDETGFPLIYLEFYRNYKEIEIPKFNFFSKVKNIKFSTSEKDFLEKVNKAKDYIKNGDFYQINLSHRIDVEGLFYKDSIFFNLIKIQPTDYMMYIKNPQFSLISGSMELFLEKDGKTITTKPIKGTRRKTEDTNLNERLKFDLLSSEKEKAENLMITDLMRNDLGKFLTNITVKNLFQVSEYSTLFQMSSTIKGSLERDISLEEIIKNTFPPGSVTGAPKKRAMEVIEELENKRRSVYCGANVLIKPNLDFVMSVAIRQILFKKENAYIFVGSGIVADSDPIQEWEETLIKSKANLKAIYGQ